MQRLIFGEPDAASVASPEAGEDVPPKGKRGGPPNRLNDLPYSEWMKFQKSFFRCDSTATLISDCIRFFTKETWPDGRLSCSLVAGHDVALDASALGNRRLTKLPLSSDMKSTLRKLKTRVGEEPYDFIFVDLRNNITSVPDSDAFVSSLAFGFFSSLRQLLRPKAYCCVVLNAPRNDGGGFPIPWAVALSARDSLKLRDEKIGIAGEQREVAYCLFFQAEDDALPRHIWKSGDLRVRSYGQKIPAYLILKPAARSLDELAHPGKFPEELVETFIELFTRPGETVLDPMVGVGSSVIAALRSGRNGFGVDLNAEFVHAARRRLEKKIPGLLKGMHSDHPVGDILQGDATNLSEITELHDIKIEYCITSPPYWSMLKNPGSEGQRGRRHRGLQTTYSDSQKDLGNLEDYSVFLETLLKVFEQAAAKIKPGHFLTVVTKNVKRNHVIYPLAWDLVRRIAGNDLPFAYLGTTLWCQDDVKLKPFAVGIVWVSNTLHHYCLHFRRA